MRRIEYVLFFVFLFVFIVVNIIIIESAYASILSFFGLMAPPTGVWGITNTVFSVLLGTLTVFTAVVIILERRDPAKTLAWVLMIVFLPIIGFILYLIIGRQFRKRRMTAKKRALNENFYTLADCFSVDMCNLPQIPTSKERLINLIHNNADFPLTYNNRVTILTDGAEIFPAFFAAVESAKEYIHLEMYIYRDDEIGNRLSNLLIAKVQAGIKVRMIVDGIGSRGLGKEYVEKMRAAGIEFHSFFPVRLSYMHSHVNYRNHRKILVIDGTIGFVGGCNIGDEYLGLDPKIGYWRETHLQIEGTAVYFLQRIFLQDWYFVTGQTLEGLLPELFPAPPEKGNKLIQITASGPDAHWEAIMQVYYYAIATAQKSVYLTSPYFIPNESILTALKTAALSGVEVKILLPAKPDHRIVFWAAMSYMEELMDAGAEVFLYQKGFLHSKVLTVDGTVSSVGSANMDQRSFNLNFEVNALVYDEPLTCKLEKDFWGDLSQSTQIDIERFRERPMRRRMLESVARLLSPLL